MLKKSDRDEKFKAKLNLAFFILYNWDPYVFYNLRSVEQSDNKNKYYLLDKLKRINFFITTISKRLIYQRKFLKDKEVLKMKYFITVLSNKKFLSSYQKFERLKNKIRINNYLFDIESTNLEHTIKILADFLIL